MPELHKVLKKCCIRDVWQDSEYFSGSQYGRILNMSELHKILNKTLHYIYLIGFWICLQFLNGRVTENWGFCVNCTLEVHGVNCILTVKRLMLFWICLRFSIYHDFECIRNLNMLRLPNIPWRPDKNLGRGHLLRENFSLCLQTRCIIVAWKKRWWVVWGGQIAEIWGCTQGAQKISKKS